MRRLAALASESTMSREQHKADNANIRRRLMKICSVPRAACPSVGVGVKVCSGCVCVQVWWCGVVWGGVGAMVGSVCGVCAVVGRQ